MLDLPTRVASAARAASFKRPAEGEAEIIKAIVDVELSQNKEQAWTFGIGGLSQLNDDFLLVREYLNIYDSANLKELCDTFGDFLLTEQDQQELAGKSDESQRKMARDNKLKPLLRPLWLFFIALCYELQEGDNELSATDAFWLGLINEVVGAQDLLSERLMYEAVTDKTEAIPA